MEHDDYLLLSGIQHYKFCKRQWALIHIEQQWVENYHTATGRLQHTKADSGQTETRPGTITKRAMPVISHALKIQGVCDVVELKKDKSGITLTGLPDTYLVYPVEYKKGKPKEGTEDHLQLTAQAMCLEEMLLTHIPYGYMFYKETKRRQKVEFTQDLRQEVTQLLTEMNQHYQRGHTPLVKKKSACKSCSLVDICLPTLTKSQTVSDYLADHVGEFS